MSRMPQRPEARPFNPRCRSRLLLIIAFCVIFAATCWLVGTILRAAS